MIDFDRLATASRLLFEARLEPVQGSRFQPTGFPDIGAATYTSGDGKEMLLVESTQSMANRLEAVCWDEAKDDVVSDLAGLPYVRVDAGRLGRTSSLHEFHRLNSPYILGDEEFEAKLRGDLGLPPKTRSEDEDVHGAIDLRKLAAVAFKYDPGSVLHGVFLEKIAGRLRLARLFSAFIEAEGVHAVESGGVKFDRLDPSGSAVGGGAEKGFGNVPHHRVEYTAQSIKAFFNLDLAALRGYGLPQAAERLLIALALWKARRWIESGLRLRTACDLDLAKGTALEIKRPDGFVIPETSELAAECKTRIAECKPAFAEPAVTEVKFSSVKPQKTEKPPRKK